MRISFFSYCIIIMGTIMVLDLRFMFSGNNILHEEAETETDRKKAEKKAKKPHCKKRKLKHKHYTLHY